MGLSKFFTNSQAVSSTVSKTVPKMSSAISNAIDSIITAWVSSAITDLASSVRRLCKKPSIRVESWMLGGRRGDVTITDDRPSPPFGLNDFAFDSKLSVPQGGFKPEPGQKSIHFEKAWGEQVDRGSVYSKFGGSTIERKGFVDEAQRETFTQARLDTLGSCIATLVAVEVANQVKAALEAKGYVVVVNKK